MSSKNASAATRRLLKRRERRVELVVVEIDEYLTSKICHDCHKRSLRELTTADGVKRRGNRSCKNCSMLWQRDVNANKNMFRITESIWRGNGRPTEIVRVPRRTTATAVTNTASLKRGI